MKQNIYPLEKWLLKPVGDIHRKTPNAPRPSKNCPILWHLILNDELRCSIVFNSILFVAAICGVFSSRLQTKQLRNYFAFPWRKLFTYSTSNHQNANKFWSIIGKDFGSDESRLCRSLHQGRSFSAAKTAFFSTKELRRRGDTSLRSHKRYKANNTDE